MQIIDEVQVLRINLSVTPMNLHILTRKGGIGIIGLFFYLFKNFQHLSRSMKDANAILFQE